MKTTPPESAGFGHRFASTLLWAIALCALSVSCSRRGTTKSDGAGATGTAATVSRSDTFVEGTGLGGLRIGETTVDSAATALGVSAADARAIGNRGVQEMKAPRSIHAFFVPPSDGQGLPRLYAVQLFLDDDVYQGKTSKGIGFLDSADAMREAYGPPDAEWIGQLEHIHYYQQGVIFHTRHPTQIPAPLYAKARAALGKNPSEGPRDRVVTGIMVVRPFTVTKAADRLMAGQQVVTGPPETDLLVGP
jgi:hypothetical protein